MLVCKGQWIPRGRTAIVCLAFLEALMSEPKAGTESQQKLLAFKSSALCRCICNFQPLPAKAPSNVPAATLRAPKAMLLSPQQARPHSQGM